MSLDVVALALAKKHANEVALGIGSMRVEGTTVYFTKIDTGEEVSVTVPTPEDGVSIETVEIDADNHLICSLSNGSTVDAGELPSHEPVTSVEITPNLKPGSVKDSYPIGTTLEQIIIDMLTEKNPPAITMILNPSATLYDAVTGKIDSLTINASVTKKTNDVVKVEFYINDSLIHTTTSNVASGGSFPYIYNATIIDDVVVKAVVTDVEGLSSTTSKTITFIGKSYYGIVEPTLSEPTEAVIKTLTTNLKNTKKLVYEGVTCDYNKVVYAYPSELGKLTSIMDKVNNFNYTTSFQQATVIVDGIEYYVYTLIDPTGADDVTLTFE